MKIPNVVSKVAKLEAAPPRDDPYSREPYPKPGPEEILYATKKSPSTRFKSCRTNVWMATASPNTSSIGNWQGSRPGHNLCYSQEDLSNARTPMKDYDGAHPPTEPKILHKEHFERIDSTQKSHGLIPNKNILLLHRVMQKVPILKQTILNATYQTPLSKLSQSQSYTRKKKGGIQKNQYRIQQRPYIHSTSVLHITKHTRSSPSPSSPYS